MSLNKNIYAIVESITLKSKKYSDLEGSTLATYGE